jgi:hypothetical protein
MQHASLRCSTAASASRQQSQKPTTSTPDAASHDQMQLAIRPMNPVPRITQSRAHRPAGQLYCSGHAPKQPLTQPPLSNTAAADHTRSVAAAVAQPLLQISRNAHSRSCMYLSSQTSQNPLASSRNNSHAHKPLHAQQPQHLQVVILHQFSSQLLLLL